MYTKVTSTRKCGCGNSIAIAVERICEKWKSDFRTRDLNKEIKTLSFGCTGKVMKFEKSKYRGVHHSLEKMNPKIKDKFLGVICFTSYLYIFFINLRNYLIIGN